MAHVSGQIATFPLTRYNVEQVSGSASDKEGVETGKTEAAARNLLLVALETLIMRDQQRALANMVMAFALLASNSTKLEALPAQTNHHSFALLERLFINTVLVNTHVQPQLIEAEKHRWPQVL
jgi:hypothetical protein